MALLLLLRSEVTVTPPNHKKMLPLLVGGGLLTPADGFLWIFPPVGAELLHVFTAKEPLCTYLWAGRLDTIAQDLLLSV